MYVPPEIITDDKGNVSVKPPPPPINNDGTYGWFQGYPPLKLNDPALRAAKAKKPKTVGGFKKKT